MNTHRIGTLSALLIAGGVTSLAQPDPSGIDFVTIGAIGNRGYDGPDPNGLATGRGRVDYEYRIGRFEVTAGQWVEFMNAALSRPDPIPWVEIPGEWPGGQTAPFSVHPSRAMQPVGGVTWRTSAIFTNWLHNNKGFDRSAFMSGAYDVSTFGYDDNGVFTDQHTRSPGARYWIPSLDEWMKAAYYDPDRPHPTGGVGAWWLYANGRDTRPVYGMPPSMGGTGEANAGFIAPGEAQFDVPLGAYTGITSPWGLFDTAGATAEYTESVYFSTTTQFRFRQFDGSAWATPTGTLDGAFGFSTIEPSVHDYAFGFRIAAAVPAPSAALVVAAGVCATHRRRRGSSPCPAQPSRAFHRSP
jgi:formylglycine-generating enzyme required for sulfatase activity